MAGPVEPEVYTSKEQSSPYFRVTPQERYDKVCRAPQLKKKARLPASGCKDEDRQGQVGLNLRFKVLVLEQVYPGRPQDTRGIGDKWVYIFRDNRHVATARQVRRGDSFVNRWSVTTKGKGSRVCDNGIELDPGPRNKRYTYVFFLSPVELTGPALSSLTKGRTLANAAVQATSDQWLKTVVVPDPLCWAADAHRKNYLPAVTAAMSTSVDVKDSARLFIGSVLKQWIEGGDPLDVENELRSGEPDRFLRQQKKRLSAPWDRAEKAGAYLAHCVDSPEYRAVMQSCMERGGLDLERAFIANAAVTGLLAYTTAGRLLATRLASSDAWVPGRYIFVDAKKALPANRIDFKKKRWMWLFAASLFNDLAPAAVGRLRRTATLLRDAQLDAEVVRLFGNIGIDQVKKERRTFRGFVERAVSKGRSLLVGQAKKGRAITFDKLVPGKIDESYIRRFEKAADFVDKRILRDYEGCLRGLEISVGSLFEIGNVVLAVMEWREAKPKDTTRAAISMVGAFADLASHGAGVAGYVLQERQKQLLTVRISSLRDQRLAARVADSATTLRRLGVAVRVAKGAAGAFALVGAVVDFTDFAAEGGKAYRERDYGKAVGHFVQSAGALLSAFSAGMVLAEAVAGSSVFGPVGFIIGCIAAALVLAGAFIASWLRLNPNEKFAGRSFLGKHATDEPSELPWTTKKLPCPGDPVEEFKVLVALLATFRVKVSSTSRLEIIPGYLDSQMQLEVAIQREWRNYDKTQTARLKIMPAQGRIEQVSGDALEKKSAFERDSKKNVNRIVISLDEENAPTHILRQYKRVLVWVRLKLEEKDTLPPNQKWLQTGLTSTIADHLKGLEYKASSLNESCHVPDK